MIFSIVAAADGWAIEGGHQALSLAVDSHSPISAPDFAEAAAIGFGLE